MKPRGPLPLKQQLRLAIGFSAELICAKANSN